MIEKKYLNVSKIKFVSYLTVKKQLIGKTMLLTLVGAANFYIERKQCH